MNRLLEIGFEPAGNWFNDAGKLRVELTRHSAQKNILYAFVCDGVVMYVGKTVRMLATRMSGYRNPGKTQTTNISNNRRLLDALDAGSAVEILALPDNGLLHYGRFHLNLAAALEDDIIRVLDPP
ncbi:GIY-YIG nuclease family protein [Variovorax sp. PAMC 28711]|uniref:GIY-YIG nuclease family protein n=1 Tax=Variovorax sp. PAMC 28711 TaxID=1795631 RepID=UPI001AF00DE9|nr:GIY-YIG nuclease family protein [Variovorax sp. PAMC 28711]